MEENKTQQNQDGFIRQVLHVLKRNIGLILAVVIIATGCGVGYSYVRNPKYTSNMRVSFSVEGNDSNTIGENIQYIDTIVDFVDEGVVVDRANAYYIKWVDEYKNTGIKIQDFYSEFKDYKISSQQYNELYDKYDRESTLKADRFIYANAITTQTKKNQNDTNWIFQIGYTDGISQDSLEKVYILVLAYEHELEGGEYFGENSSLKINISNLGFDGVSMDMSRLNIIIVAATLGFVLALILVYIKNFLDNTIKDKAELEMITGTEVLGCIELLEEGKNGK